jgi:hypothetical protein
MYLAIIDVKPIENYQLLLTLKGVDFTNCDIDHICISDNWNE